VEWDVDEEESQSVCCDGPACTCVDADAMVDFGCCSPMDLVDDNEKIDNGGTKMAFEGVLVVSQFAEVCCSEGMEVIELELEEVISGVEVCNIRELAMDEVPPATTSTLLVVNWLIS
jgi:hypothetical protein